MREHNGRKQITESVNILVLSTESNIIIIIGCPVPHLHTVVLFEREEL